MSEKRTCSIEGCTNPLNCRTWCSTHYWRWRKTDTTDPPRQVTLVERMWRNFRVTESGCWEWTAARNSNGYGVVSSSPEGYSNLAHRALYQLLVGPIPDHLPDLDHLCRNPPCINPLHLEPVTHKENMLRGKQAQATHCKNGHEWTEENTYWRKDTNTRQCRTCGRERRQRKAHSVGATISP